MHLLYKDKNIDDKYKVINKIPEKLKEAYLSTTEQVKPIASVEHLAKLIKQGEVRAQEAGNYHNPNSKVRYAYLVSPITIDGIDYSVA